jgi:uncharacterized protein (DUF433 family)
MSDQDLQADLMDWNGCAWVESVPDRMHGTPVLLRTRMPADGIIENYDEGVAVDELVEDYGIDKDAVLGVLEFSGRLKQATAA